MTIRRLAGFVVLVLALASRPLAGQERGAAALAELMRGLGVNTRVLVIGAHPDDEDTQLITWLARGRNVETAYLSLTRGDGGQNLIGNELGEALGAIRTEELLAARRLDGGHQYFTRAFDFGFSKSAEETYKHWPKDSVLRDVVTVVRSFRPHVIIAIFTGTPRDGHGHHQVSGILAREAYEVAGDSVRFPPRSTAGLPPWAAGKFYRSARWFGGETATLRFDVGEYSPLRGRSYAEIAAESRSQHKSQAMGELQRKGSVIDMVRREATRAPAPQDPKQEQSIFDGIDTTWARVRRGSMKPGALAAIDSLPAAIAAAQRAYDARMPERAIQPLGRIRDLIGRLHSGCANDTSPVNSTNGECVVASDGADSDLQHSLAVLAERTSRALELASGVAIEASVAHESWASSEPVVAKVVIYNRSQRPVSANVAFLPGHDAPRQTLEIAPFATATLTDSVRITTITEPWWLSLRRVGDIFRVPIGAISEDARHGPNVSAEIVADGARFELAAPLVYRFADPIKGEVNRPVAIVPAIALTIDQPVQYVPANRPIDRVIRISLRSASNHARTARVALQLPAGLTTDSASQTIGLPDYAGNFGSEPAPKAVGRSVASQSPERTVEFRVRGTLPEGSYTIAAVAESEGATFTSGYALIDYEHIRPQRLYRQATVALSAVNANVASGRTVAYIPGVGDNVAPMLQQLGVALTVIEPDKLAGADLSKFNTIVVGPRAYESSPALIASNPRLLGFARAGGTLVVQYGQFEMANPGIMPYPITHARPADRVTEEDAPVRVLDPASPLLNAPNKIGAKDFDGWVQERSLYMPRSHDARYTGLLSMNDTGEPPNDGAILVAPLGTGTYVYTTLSLFRQLPAGNAGGARIFLNLLSADQRSARSVPTPVRP